MSVYTTIEKEQLAIFLSHYEVGELDNYQGISDGIENTNYFVNTTQGRFVLTIFEHHSFAEMQYYLNLMHHLAHHKVPSANPVADKKGDYLSLFHNKPIALVERLDGGSIIETSVDHCAQLGAAMGKMHTAGLGFSSVQSNSRGPAWCQQTAIEVQEKLSTDERKLLDDEVGFQLEQMGNDRRLADLPRGVIHADLFRDNALWHNHVFSGIIDFYYSCDDVLLYDLAVTINDWCLNDDFSLNRDKVTALLSHYHQYRTLTTKEQEYWPTMLRAGALRFWLSRLYDKHFPRTGELVHTKNPDDFKSILCDRIKNGDDYRDYWFK
ncbi:MAG: homoserine kinase [Gammaproteobacteria bacterium]|nr:MAG: homoserine kinase [Gammaproteobacteria bacterium]